jgi:hypothetical protein
MEKKRILLTDRQCRLFLADCHEFGFTDVTFSEVREIANQVAEGTHDNADVIALFMCSQMDEAKRGTKEETMITNEERAALERLRDGGLLVSNDGRNWNFSHQTVVDIETAANIALREHPAPEPVDWPDVALIRDLSDRESVSRFFDDDCVVVGWKDTLEVLVNCGSNTELNRQLGDLIAACIRFVPTFPPREDRP